MFSFKPFQRQDLARGALHDGLIDGRDTGLGKSIYGFAWAFLKTGWTVVPRSPTSRLPCLTRSLDPLKRTCIQPNAPILFIVPGDLHEQMACEGWDKFKTETYVLDSQAAWDRLARSSESLLPQLDATGRPLIPPGCYITSYTQLTTKGVQKLPDPLDWPKPRELLVFTCLPETLPTGRDLEREATERCPDSFLSVAQVFTWRDFVWREDYDLLQLHKDDTRPDLDRAYERELEALANWPDKKAAANQARKLAVSYGRLQNLVTYRNCPQYSELTLGQQDFVIREYLHRVFQTYATGIGTERAYPIGPKESRVQSPESTVRDSLADSGSDSGLGTQDSGLPDTRPKWRIKCLYTPSLADLCYDAFDAIVIDEGVKMKGEDTLVGRGVRSMESRFRCVLTATPIKNRLPDIFRLAWWATGGLAAAHARFPYRDDRSEREEFAGTFMVSERNLTKEAKAKEEQAASKRRHQEAGVTGGTAAANGRFKKVTAEICNVHRLWKLLAPIVLRRRKDECGEDIVPKLRKVIRCEPGTQQQRVYRYHLEAPYLDINGEKAIGAQLQALRIAAADPSSDCLQDKGPVVVTCACSEPRPSGSGSAEDKEKRRKGEKGCPACNHTGKVALPHRAANPYVPKLVVTLELIREILERKEQVVVFSAFNDPLDFLSGLLRDATVPHLQLDGRTGQRQRGTLAAQFKAGRGPESIVRSPESGDTHTNGGSDSGRWTPDSGPSPIPVLLAGVECMAEGHSFHRCNNAILIAYSWAYDKFKQALDRVHRMNSEKPVNIYVVLCNGTIDRKLESLVQEKTDSVELALDGRLIGERTEDVSLAELLAVARAEFDPDTVSVDEAAIQRSWPALRAGLQASALAWMPPRPVPSPESRVPSPARRAVRVEPAVPLAANWREQMQALAAQLRSQQSSSSDIWDSL